jgi:hypothetical protein
MKLNALISYCVPLLTFCLFFAYFLLIFCFIFFILFGVESDIEIGFWNSVYMCGGLGPAVLGEYMDISGMAFIEYLNRNFFAVYGNNF